MAVHQAYPNGGSLYRFFWANLIPSSSLSSKIWNMPSISRRGRFQFSVEKEYKVRKGILFSMKISTNFCAASTPCLCPNDLGKARCFAHRPIAVYDNSYVLREVFQVCHSGRFHIYAGHYPDFSSFSFNSPVLVSLRVTWFGMVMSCGFKRIFF